VSSLFLLLAFTDDFHGLIRPAVRLVPGEPFTELTYGFTLTFWLMALYAVGLTLLGMSLLVRRFFGYHGLYRAQAGTVLVGLLIPMVGGVLTLLGVQLGFHRDTTPFTVAIGNLVVTWGLFRYRLFDIVPAAREAVIESMSDAVIVLDAQGRVVDLNPAAQAAIGRAASEVIGQPADQVYSDWPDLVERLRNVQATHIEIALELQKEQRHVDLRLSPLRDRRGRLTGRLIIARDITERKRAEEEIRTRTLELETVNQDLEAANEQLQVLSRVKDEFVSNVSHELRTPITNLKLYHHLLAAQPKNYDSYFATLGREIGRLEDMIEALLTLSRLDQSRTALNLASVELNTLTEEFVMDRLALAESKGLTLTLRKWPESLAARADRDLIGQVLSILLTNALNYTPAGGQVIVSVQNLQRDDQQWAGFRVSDTGPGIFPAEQPKLFTRFFRGKVGRESHVSGTGLGLAIAKEIVDRHRGRIEVESEGIPGKGATFSIWLPVQDG